MMAADVFILHLVFMLILMVLDMLNVLILPELDLSMQIILRVCILLDIKKLSDIVIEELDESHTIQTLGSLGSVLLVAIKQKLSSKSLQTAVWTIVNSMGNYVPAFKSFSLDTIDSLLNSTAEKLQFAKCPKTKFLLLTNLIDVTCVGKDFTIPERKNDSAHQTLYFMNQSRGCILVAEPPTYISLSISWLL